MPVFNREADNSVDVSASDSVGTENTLIPLEPNLNMDSQEEFQYVLELSKKTATVKEDNPNKNTDCDHFKQLKMKKPPLSSLDKEASEIPRSKDRETNVNISESKQNLGNSDDEDLKRALELSLQEDQHLIKESSEGIHKKKLIDDEEYARRLQRELDEEYELSKQSNLSKIETRSIKQEVVSPKKPLETTCEYTEKFDDLDAVIAQSLHEEINSPGPKGNKHLLLHDEEIAKQLNKEFNNPRSSGKLTAIWNQKGLGDEVCVEDFVEENREERSRQIQMDEDLARQLLESEDNYTSKGSEHTVVSRIFLGINFCGFSKNESFNTTYW